MKKTTLIFGSAALLILASVFAIGCKNGSGAKGTAIIADTTGLSEFQAWKAEQQQEEMAAMAAAQHTASVSRTQSTKMTSTSTNEAKVAKKKGWSKAAKYAVIGGVTGGVGGAIINKKNPVKGAVIGAVILGGGGYIFGRSKDKKEGRY